MLFFPGNIPELCRCYKFQTSFSYVGDLLMILNNIEGTFQLCSCAGTCAVLALYCSTVSAKLHRDFKMSASSFRYMFAALWEIHVPCKSGFPTMPFSNTASIHVKLIDRHFQSVLFKSRKLISKNVLTVQLYYIMDQHDWIKGDTTQTVILIQIDWFCSSIEYVEYIQSPQRSPDFPLPRHFL